MGVGMLTIDKLKYRLDYNSETGLFVHKTTIGGTHVGQIAGTPNTNGHIQIMLYRKFYLAHNLAWFYVTGELPLRVIDHINRKYDDNRFCNLRKATLSQNSGNTKSLHVNNKSGYKGVYFNKVKHRWIAQIGIHNKRKHIGHFCSAEEAFAAYKKEADLHFGEFANY